MLSMANIILYPCCVQDTGQEESNTDTEVVVDVDVVHRFNRVNGRLNKLQKKLKECGGGAEGVGHKVLNWPS